MDNINEENEPEEHEQTEPTEADDSTSESETSWTVDADATVEESVLDDPTVDDATLVDDDTVDGDSLLEDAAGLDDSALLGDTTPVDEIIDEEPFAGITTPPAPPALQAVPQQDRLTRDPFATFGGVLSGIAHRYGWDVSLTRLAFVVLLIVSGGTALFAYFLAWLIIPRASHWPPARVSTGRSRLSGRDLGMGLVGLGALVVLGIGSGEAAAVLVPLALVGGGIWLLIQNPREGEVLSPAAAGAPVGNAVTPFAETQPFVAPTQPFVATQPLGAPTQPPVAPAPVPKRSRLRRFGIMGVFGFLGLALLSVIAIPLILIAVITDGDFDIDADAEYVFRPANIAEIQNVIIEDVGVIKLDLRNVDFDSISGSDTPVRIDVELDVGRIEVLLPEDVRVSVDAETDLGDVTVLGSNDDGIKPSRRTVDEDPQLDLELDLNIGEIEVTRGNRLSTTVIEVN